MYGIENRLYEQLTLLKNEYNVHGLKGEFEAEGSSYRDLARLRRITEKAGIKLHLKIGGVEAMRDMKDSMEIGVDGLIAPMVESIFGVKKFRQAYDKVYKDHKIHLSINIESRCAIENIDGIAQVDFAVGIGVRDIETDRRLRALEKIIQDPDAIGQIPLSVSVGVASLILLKVAETCFENRLTALGFHRDVGVSQLPLGRRSVDLRRARDVEVD